MYIYIYVIICIEYIYTHTLDEVVIASVSPHAWFVAAGVVENITDQVEPPEVTATSHKDHKP